MEAQEILSEIKRLSGLLLSFDSTISNESYSGIVALTTKILSLRFDADEKCAVIIDLHLISATLNIWGPEGRVKKLLDGAANDLFFRR